MGITDVLARVERVAGTTQVARLLSAQPSFVIEEGDRSNRTSFGEVTGDIFILERMKTCIRLQFSVYSFHGIRSTGTAARRSFRSSSP